jgi:hypothetical protein
MSMADEELMSLLEEEDEVRTEPLTTLGELFADGSAIDLLRNHRLVLWSEAKEQVDLLVQHQGQSYLPASLNSRLEELLRFPQSAAPSESPESLVAELSSCLARYVELDESMRLLLAAFVLSTWVGECLPFAPVLNLWGPFGAETILVDVLSCLCRRPLRLLQPSVRELSELPRGLCPTVVLKQAEERSLRRLLSAAAEPDVHLLRGGIPLNIRCAVIACTRSPLSVPGLSLALLQPAKYARLGTQGRQLADDFQPRLLRYRLSQHRLVANSDFDCQQFSPEVRQQARVLGAAVAGAPALQAGVAAALEALDEQSRVEHSQNLDAVVLEALLVLCHENNPAAYVLEVTTLTNGILLARHEQGELSPKAVGAILRKKLGLSLQRKGPGYELALGRDVCRHIHRLAASYGALSLLSPRPDCPGCGELFSAREAETPQASA